MLNSISLENFQGIAGYQKLRLAPVTLLFGPNSSGKSSITRALRFAQQSFTDNLHERENFFLAKGASIDLGNFSNFVHRHDVEKVVTLGVGLPFTGSLLIECSEVDFSFGRSLDLSKIRVSGAANPPDGVAIPFSDFTLTFEPAAESSAQEDGQSRDYTPWVLSAESHDTFIELVKVAILSREKIRDEMNFFHFRAPRRRPDYLSPLIRQRINLEPENINENLLALLSKVVPADVAWRIRIFTPVIDSLPFDEEIADFDSSSEKTGDGDLQSLQLKALLRRTMQEVADRIFATFTRVQHTVSRERMAHIGPLRSVPERINFVSTGTANHRSDGGSVVNNLAINTSRRRQISDWLLKSTDNKFALDFLQFQAETGSEIFGDAGALVLVDVKNDSRVAFTDAGVGFSQILPILEHILNQDHVTDSDRFGFLTGSILLVEQPELHLHPKMQGELLSLIVSQTTMENSALQVIAETHSESFVLKLQQHIRKGDISCEDVSIIYVDKDPDSGVTTAKELELSPNGDFLDDWPMSFSQLRFEQAQF